VTPSTLIKLDAMDPGSITIDIAGDPAPDATPEVIERWEAMRGEKPRLFNGPVLSYLGWSDRVVRASRDTYQRLAVQEHEPAIVEPAVMQLSVTGLVTALDEHGERHVLVGRRSHATRIYGGMWELGPSGGIDAPPLSQRSLDGFDVFRQLVQEMREETGLPADPDPGPLVAITVDRVATSADLVMRIDLARPVDEIVAHTDRAGEHGWEYESTRWIACAEFGAFVESVPCIPPTVALAGIVRSTL
jgi:8-oxo-dGTP pyrophosphatase MutT (NUDIX family)